VSGGERARRDGRVAAGLAQLRGYGGAWFRADALAGVTVTAYLVPQCLAYAELAGSPPATGLWVAVVGMLVYALLGTSRLLSVGPESATAIMVAAAVAPLAAGDPDRYLALSAGLALLVGLVCLGAFLLRMGFVADLLSQPILVGYMAGVAVIMIGSQLGTLTGVTLEADTTVGRIIELARSLDGIQPATLTLGVAVTVFLFVLRWRWPLAPAALFAVVGAAVITAVLGLDAQGIEIVGSVPSGLPTPAFPALAWTDVTALVGSAAAITFVGYSDVALTGRAFAARNGETIDPNRELLAMGAANVAAGLTGGFALSASGSRTAIVDAMHARSQAAGIVAAVSVIVVVLALPDLIALIPKAALGGIVIYAGWRLVDFDGIRRLWRFRTTELALAAAAFGGVLLFDVLAGILVAIGLSVADLFVRVARPPAAVLGRVPGLGGLHNIEDYPDAEQVPGLIVFRYDAPLCFANAQDFRSRALAAVDAQAVPVEWFLLNSEAIVELDLTAADALRDLTEDLEARGIVFAMARVKQDLRAQLARGGLLGIIDEDRMYPTLPVALVAFEARQDRR
jgi:sulfate permease, SulP family